MSIYCCFFYKLFLAALLTSQVRTVRMIDLMPIFICTLPSTPRPYGSRAYFHICYVKKYVLYDSILRLYELRKNALFS